MEGGHTGEAGASACQPSGPRGYPVAAPMESIDVWWAVDWSAGGCGGWGGWGGGGGADPPAPPVGMESRAAANSGMPLPSVATVWRMGQLKPSVWSSNSTRSAPGGSDLLTTKISAISMMPALIAWTSSPKPGTSTTTVTWATEAISISSWPTPTVSMMT